MTLQAGKMYRPTDVAFDIANNIVYVVEQFNHRISKWNYTPGSFDFTLDASWGTNGDGTTGKSFPIGDGSSTDVGLYRPSGIVLDITNGLLYVTDTFHHRVRIITASDGEFTASVGSSGSGAANFHRPAGIAINATGSFVVIADEFNHRAVRYATNGTTLITPTVLDDPTTGVGLSFVRPHGVVFDVTDTSFNISDSQRGLISRYDDGSITFVDQFGTPGRTGRVPAVNGTELFFPASGKGLLGGTTTTVFADTRNNNLKTLNGTTITITTADGTTPNAGTVGTGDGQLYWPESVSAFVDTANYVLAANTLNNRVETFSSDVAVLTAQSPFNFGKP